MVQALGALFEVLNEDSEAVLWVTEPGYQANVYISSNYQNIWGRSPQHLYEQALDFYKTIHPDDLEEHQRKCNENIKDNNSHDVMYYRIVQPSGGIKYIKDRHFVLIEPNNKILGFAGIARNLPAKNWEIERERYEQSIAINQYDLISKYVVDKLRSQASSSEPSNIDAGSARPHVIALSDNRVISLTTKENECLKLLMQGKSAKQSAAILHVSPRTVEFHLENIKNKVGCRNKLELLSKVIQQQNSQETYA